MRILHITTVRYGSTGRTASDLKAALANETCEYRLAFSEKDSKPLDGDILIGSTLDHKLHALLSRVSGLQGYFSYFSTKRFLKQVKEYNPDIVVLGNLHSNYINLPLLFDFLAKERIKVVMILHDCWLFTGHCTHFTSHRCDNWKKICCNCPDVKKSRESWFFDRSKKIFSDRFFWYNNLNSLSVVAVSDWEASLAIQSPLFKNAKVTRIYNWINTEVFKPATQHEIEAVKMKYSLSSELNYLITVGAGWTSTSSKTSDAIDFASKLPYNYRLIIVGYCDDIDFPSSVIHIQYTSNQKELSALYSASIAYLHFSIEDTFGKVIAEAMSCEVVPIVFNSTACGEIASPYGIIVSPHDVHAMLDSINLATDGERRKAVRKYALQNYSRSSNIELYEEFFKQILSDEKN